MFKLPKAIAFILLVIVTVLLAVTFTNIDWSMLSANNDFALKFKEVREPLIFLILTVFYVKYYVARLKEDQ